MLFDKKITYEVQTGDGSRWVLESVHKHKTDATSRAQSLVNSMRYPSVRIVRYENDENEKLVFQTESSAADEKPMSISSIEQAAMCETVDDVFGFESRKTLGRLLRRYLDDKGMTPLELIHDIGHVRAFSRTQPLFDQAMNRIASIQARTAGIKANDRLDAVYALTRKVEDRLREYEDVTRFVDDLKSGNLSRAMEHIAGEVRADRRLHVARKTVASLTRGKGDWKPKLDLLLDLVNRETSTDALTILDEAAAEILDGAAATQEVIGPKPNLASALSALALLAQGRHPLTRDGDTTLDQLNEVIISRNLAKTREVVLTRISRALSGMQSLTRENDAADKAALIDLIGNLIDLAGFAGGPEMCQAITQRARIVLGDDGQDLTADAGIAAVLSHLPYHAARIGYLVELNQSEFGERYRLGVLKPLMGLVEALPDLDDLLPAGSTGRDVEGIVADLQRRVSESDLGPEIGELIVKKLARLLQGTGGRQSSHESSTDTTAQPTKKTPAKANTSKRDMNRRDYAAGEIIFREGDLGDEAYMISNGEVEISVSDIDARTVIATLGRGQILGEMALVDDQPRMATATARTAATLTVIPEEAFRKRLEWLAGEDRLMSYLLETFVERLRDHAGGG